ncbi:unnamed protein product [Pleuronectes platessa]|uniref:Uncharacterized protein n=1 Tax=Pleuronectes platessa TaxID=8262 RepID=A0A9N7VX20_PLEPL|nr:unnamed protein product [Pleuronectes platessa]
MCISTSCLDVLTSAASLLSSHLPPGSRLQERTGVPLLAALPSSTRRHDSFIERSPECSRRAGVIITPIKTTAVMEPTAQSMNLTLSSAKNHTNTALTTPLPLLSYLDRYDVNRGSTDVGGEGTRG